MISITFSMWQESKWFSVSRLQLREVYAESELFIRDLDIISIMNAIKMSDKPNSQLDKRSEGPRLLKSTRRVSENSHLKLSLICYINLKCCYIKFLEFYLSMKTPSALDHQPHVLGILSFICQEADVAAHVEHPGLRGLHRPSNPFRTLQQYMPSRIPPCRDNREISETISYRIGTVEFAIVTIFFNNSKKREKEGGVVIRRKRSRGHPRERKRSDCVICLVRV